MASSEKFTSLSSIYSSHGMDFTSAEAMMGALSQIPSAVSL